MTRPADFPRVLRRLVTGDDGRMSPARLAVLACLALAWGVMLWYPVLATEHLQTPFPGFSIEPNGVLSPFGRSTWARFQVEPPLAEPEKLVSVDGVPVSTSAALVQRLRTQYPSDEQAFFTFVMPDGASRTLLLPLQPWPLADFVDLFLVPYFVALAGLALATWVFLALDDQTGRVFTMAMVTLALNLGLVFALVMMGHFARLWITTMALSGALLIHLGLVFPHPVRWLEKCTWCQYLPYGVALALVVAGHATLYHWPHSWAFIGVWRGIYLTVGVGMLFFLGMQVSRLLRPRSATARRQSRIVLMGATLALTPVIFWLFSNILGYPRPFGGIYAPFALCLPVALTYAVLRYRLTNVDALLARGVTYGAVALLGVGGYYALLGFLAEITGYPIPPHDVALVALLVLLGMVLAFPLRTWAQRQVDRLFQRGLADYHGALLRYRHALTGMQSPEAIVAALEAQVAALGPRWTALWLRAPADAAYRPTRGEGEMAPAAWVQRVMAHDATFVLDPARHAADAALGQPDAALCVPLWCGETLLGWLLLGRRQDDLPYTPAELEFVAALAEAAAPALDHAHRFAALHAEIEALRGQVDKS